MSLLFLLALLFAPAVAHAQQKPTGAWVKEFPNTDFTNNNIDLGEIVDDGNTRFSFPTINEPKFKPAKGVTNVGPLEPVLSLIINGDARAYPLRMLLWHEIVNDVVGGVPVLVSYCPLCNSGVVFDRRLGNTLLKFGNTGRIRHADMVMYDENTESWWQQFTGGAIIGEMTGKEMKLLPARLESLQKFRDRAPDGKLLVPNNNRLRPYGLSPYQGMERRAQLFREYPLPKGIRQLQRLVVIGEEAWPVENIRRAGTLEAGGLVFKWVPGQNSLHDTRIISGGRDVGNVTVQKREGDKLVDFPYDITFAFAFSAFRPNGKIHLN